MHVGDDKVSIRRLLPYYDLANTGHNTGGKSLDMIDMSIELSVAVNSFGPFVIDNGIVPTRVEYITNYEPIRPNKFNYACNIVDKWNPLKMTNHIHNVMINCKDKPYHLFLLDFVHVLIALIIWLTDSVVWVWFV